MILFVINYSILPSVNTWRSLMKKLIVLCLFIVCFSFTMALAGGMHHHDKVEVKDRSHAPTLKLEVLKDKISGWNVHMITTDFRFTPENVNQPHQEGEGHAHLYINKKKIRVYSPYFHIMSLPKGKVTIRATLNANTHAEYTLDKNVIADSITINN